MAVTRTAIVAGNWKMHYGPRQASDFAMEIMPSLGHITRSYSHIMCILCPPTISLSEVREVIDAMTAPRVELGAQNMFYEEKGAYTGEISPAMVREMCTTVILGHSERRMYFAENDELVNKKTLAAFKHHLRPIVCVGENLAQYEGGQTEQVIRTQIKGSLANLPEQYTRETVIAYEPVWAIGTGKAATAEDAGKVIHLIRELYEQMYSSDAASAIRILYGGSVTSSNIGEFIQHPDIDGALVGGASLKPDFVEIARKTVQTMQQ